MSALTNLKRLSYLWILQIISGWVSGWLLVLLVIPLVLGMLSTPIVGLLLGIIPIGINIYTLYLTLLFNRIENCGSLKLGIYISLLAYFLALISFCTNFDTLLGILGIAWSISTIGSLLMCVGFIKIGKNTNIRLWLFGGILYAIFPPIGGILIGIGYEGLRKSIQELLNSDVVRKVNAVIINRIFDRQSKIPISGIKREVDLPETKLKLLIATILEEFPLGKIKEELIVVNKKLQETLIRLEYLLPKVAV